MGRRPTDKRDRLVSAAAERFHRQGYAGTSLADVARAAGLSAGNVFYYFRTKEELAHAVVDAWCDRLAAHLATLDEEPDGWVRLRRYVAGAAERRDGYVSLGCPLAGLARDLPRESEALKADVPRLYAVQRDWVREQFLRLGFTPEEAASHASFLMASFNGAILLAYAQSDDGMIVSGVESLQGWLRQLEMDMVPEVRGA